MLGKYTRGTQALDCRCNIQIVLQCPIHQGIEFGVIEGMPPLSQVGLERQQRRRRVTPCLWRGGL